MLSMFQKSVQGNIYGNCKTHVGVDVTFTVLLKAVVLPKMQFEAIVALAEEGMVNQFRTTEMGGPGVTYPARTSRPPILSRPSAD